MGAGTERMADRNGVLTAGMPAGPEEWERVLEVGLATLRQARGWSQTALARRSGLHRRTIWLLEHPEPNTHRTKPRPGQQTIKALARAFGYVHLSDLWVALQGSAALDVGTPLLVGERLRHMILAYMECTLHQQQFIESLIHLWAVRQRAEMIGQAHLLDIDGLLKQPGA